MPELEDLVQTNEAAEILGVNGSRIRQMVLKKQLVPVLGTKGQGKYFLRSEVETFARTQRRAGRPRKQGTPNP